LPSDHDTELKEIAQESASTATAPEFSILIIEDDPVLSEQLCKLLQGEGFGVDVCYNGCTGMEAASSHHYQLILLDVMLPKMSGFELLANLREHSQVPVIILSAKGAEEERIKGLRNGADDYISKPYNSQELLLRIEALLRRCHPSLISNAPSTQTLDSLSVNRVTHKVQVGSNAIDFTPIEFKLLRALMSSPGEILSKALLYQIVLNRSYSSYDRSLDMHLSRVRRKLNAAGWDGSRLQTVHGKGYLLS